MSDRGKVKKSAIAGGTISANTFIKWNASGQAIVCSVAGEQVAGVACHDVTSGEVLAYWPVGSMAQVKTSGILTPGTNTTIATTAAGLATAAAAGDRIAAVPHYNPGQAAAASGDLLWVEVASGELFDSSAILADIATAQADIITNAGNIATNLANITQVESLVRGIDMTVGAEAANVINVTISVTDQDGALLAGTHMVELNLRDISMVESLAAAFTMAIGALGTAVSTTAKPQFIINTDASGVADVNITDVAGASNTTINLVARVLQSANGDPVLSSARRAAITFDAA